MKLRIFAAKFISYFYLYQTKGKEKFKTLMNHYKKKFQNKKKLLLKKKDVPLTYVIDHLYNKIELDCEILKSIFL